MTPNSTASLAGAPDRIGAPGNVSQLITPVLQSERISIIDSLRGFALLGILIMNIVSFGMPYEYGLNLELHHEYSGPNFYAWCAETGFFEGTMRALFSMLFGAGSILLLSRLEKRYTGLGISPADIYYRRLFWLLLFGNINAYILLWSGDILYTYAICGLFLFPFRNMKAKHLLIVGLFLMTFCGLKSFKSRHDKLAVRAKGESALLIEKQNGVLTPDQQQDKAAWLAVEEQDKAENIRKKADNDGLNLHKGYFGVMRYVKHINEESQTIAFYHDYFWDALTFFFLGMALFKWDVLTGKRSTRFYWVCLVAGYTAGSFISYYLLKTQIDAHFDPTRVAQSPAADFYQPRRFLIAMGHIGLVMLVYKYGLLKWLLRALANLGQMAFTGYLSQSIICGLVFYGYGLNLYGSLQRYQLYYIVPLIWIFQLVFSAVWLKYFRFGPFEWLWRSLTYWELQPFRRRSPRESSSLSRAVVVTD
ncbi:MAG: DUF418 domain-containing protein [Puia sp.]|nr:DUF418 domain-containing protein [Puia sp.]